MAILDIDEVTRVPFDPLPPYLASLTIGFAPPLPEAGASVGEVSVREIVERALDRIAAENDRLRAFITVLDVEARSRAVQLDEMAARRGAVGPLHGVTVAVKDCIDVAGAPTTCGTDIRRDHVARKTAPCVLALEAAGAVIIGKTNLHEWAFGATSDNPWFGRVLHPTDRRLGPGGSSGGSAVAVATGMAQLALGTDTGGSVRIPAAFCGIAGLKPTIGRVDTAGVEPLSWSLDTVGPLARTVCDLTTAYRVLRSTGRAFKADVAQPLLRPPHLGVIPDFFGHPQRTDADVLMAVQRALARLEAAGARITVIEVPELQEVRDTFFPIVLAEASVVHDGPRRGDRRRYGQDIQHALLEGDGVTANRYLSALRWRPMLAAALLRVLRGVDVIVSPTSAISGLPHDPHPFAWPGGLEEPAIEAAARFCLPASLVGFPAASLPLPQEGAGFVGLQVMGGPGSEDQVLDVASWVEAQY
jgi:aspartyl-tRNA(Asn)/glutamyl-tRNA(Gln) amidotransferase subunit A